MARVEGLSIAESLPIIELAALTGESLTVALQVAIQERLERVRRREVATRAREQVDRIITRGRQFPLLDERSAEEILGYDEVGLPTRWIVDSSALVAVVLGEPDAAIFRDVMVDHSCRTSAVSLVESSIVLELRVGPEGGASMNDLLRILACEVDPVDAEQALLAIAAWRRFGKGRHPAGLNLGDCFSYALARATGETLLFKGHDFDQTDVASARP